MKVQKKCSICSQPIPKRVIGINKETNEPIYWDDGDNAEPVNSGRCCSDCNYKVVIPARLGVK